MDKQDIISILIKQHRTLQAEVKEIIKVLGNDPIDIQIIVNGLIQFEKDLTEHLELENKIFYKELLEKMEEKGQDTIKTKSFIAEMDEITETVVVFLKKYEKADNIENSLDEFIKEFNEIGEILNLRIQSEEAEVYFYWNLF